MVSREQPYWNDEGGGLGGTYGGGGDLHGDLGWWWELRVVMGALLGT